MEISLRRTVSQFTTQNPVLAPGEIAFESDTSNIRVGDGATAYASLPAVVSSATAIDGGNASGNGTGVNIDGGSATG